MSKSKKSKEKVKVLALTCGYVETQHQACFVAVHPNGFATLEEAKSDFRRMFKAAVDRLNEYYTHQAEYYEDVTNGFPEENQPGGWRRKTAAAYRNMISRSYGRVFNDWLVCNNQDDDSELWQYFDEWTYALDFYGGKMQKLTVWPVDNFDSFMDDEEN